MSSISRCGADWYRPTVTPIHVVTVLLLAACASSPPAPESAMNAARRAIVVADLARITDASSPELTEARVRLAASDAAMQAGHMLAAERLAEESRVDAELAVTQANASHDHAVSEELQRGTDALAQHVKPIAGAEP